jgi:allophanate hydrolase subunit 2
MDIFKQLFEIDTLNDRMGYQLKQGITAMDRTEIITSSLIPGTVQLTPSGKLIIMMRDCPTTGGYPRILQLTDDAINKLAQKKTGDTIRFEMEGTFSFLRRLASRYRD